MNNWKQSLDKYLTTEPEDNFTPWVEKVIDLIPEDKYDAHVDWFQSGDGVCNHFLNRMYNKGWEPQRAANFLNRIDINKNIE